MLRRALNCTRESISRATWSVSAPKRVIGARHREWETRTDAVG